MEAIKKWLSSNTTSARLTRTIVSGIIGVLIANIDYLVGFLHFSAEGKAFIVAICMCILSPIMSELRGKEVVVDGEENS